MNEIDLKNQESYLALLDRFWEFDPEARKYIENRISDKWQPPEEYKELFDSFPHNNDQRIRFKISTADDNFYNFFAQEDQSFITFKSHFRYVINLLNNDYGINISYKNFMENKVLFKGNITKLKKVFTVCYMGKPDYARKEFSLSSSTTIDEKLLESNILSRFEQIGTQKKPMKDMDIVLSFNPVDWLLCSTAGKISSCLNMENTSSNGYKFFEGLPHLCGDPNRAEIYITISGQKKTFRGMEVDEAIFRSWVLLNTSNEFCILKWYPKDIIDVKPLNKIANDKINFCKTLRGTRAKYPIVPLPLKSGLVSSIYNDDGGWRLSDGKIYQFGNCGKSGFQVFYKDKLDVTNFRTINFDSLPSLGENTAYKLSHFEKHGISFDSAIPQKFCSMCGKKKTTIYDKNKNRTICLDCYIENIFICPVCMNSYSKDETSKTRKIKLNGGIVEGIICEDCLRNILIECDECKTLIHKDYSFQTENKKYICGDCVTEHKYQRCDDCGSYTKTYAKIFDRRTNSLSTLCSKHIVLATGESNAYIKALSNDFFSFDLMKLEEDYNQCKICNSFVARGNVCPACSETLGRGFNI